MIKRKYSIIFCLTVLFLLLGALSSLAEFDQTRKMKAKAQYYFDRGEYYKAIDVWAEVLKIDSYDKEALQGISKAQEIIDGTQSEKEIAQGQKLRELIQKGKNYYQDREYQKALSTWGEALSIEPTNQEVLDLIEEARIKARYQINILDKLDKERRLKTPYIDDLDKIANKMIGLLEKADVKIREEKIEKEVATKIEEEKEFIRAAFAKGERFYKEGKFEEAISEWNKTLPYLPESSEITVKIAELKERIANEEKKEKENLKLEQREKAPIEKEKTKKQKPSRSKGFLLIAPAILLALFFVNKFTARTRIEPYLAKAFPKKTQKKREFDPRDLGGFLKKKKKDEDKDLFK
ncbi:MAG: hypothetical protein JSV30_04485 [Candidatus Omnitrophota bacterium]|nr:MAG: hypothetical protein JSV30_04485 [Candidatus Omnitrophota bacterium]